MRRNIFQPLISKIIPSSVFAVHSINGEGSINKVVRLDHLVSVALTGLATFTAFEKVRQ